METDNRSESTTLHSGWGRKFLGFLNWKALLFLCVVVFGLIALQSLRGNTHPALEVANLVTVAVAKVTRENLAETQTFQAEFRPYQEIDLHAKVAGFVQSISVDIGDKVQQGEVLATLEIPELQEDLEKATAVERRNEEEIKLAAAAHDDAHLAFTRISNINKAKPHLIAQQELDTAQARDRTTEAALAAARQGAQVSQAEVKKLKAMLGYCKITAPFSGVITRRFADEGALIQGGVSPSTQAMPLVRLSQNDRLRLIFPVSVSYVSRIAIGEPVEIAIQASGKTISGTICRATKKVDTATRTMEVEVDVPNADLSLIPGIYASVALKLDHREKVLTVPTEALSRQKATTVYVLTQQNEVEERPVTLGLETPDKVEIVAGLHENDLVIIGTRAQVKSGQKVTPKLMEMGKAE
ncbi:MAG: Efflux transporter, family, subunit [Pedosphaera sp.]|nr:Efflux transporter, family, subunit [Pedosphaera sp.]